MKKKSEPTPPPAPKQTDAPMPRADLAKEFGPTLKLLLIEALTVRVAKLARCNKGLYVAPVDQDQVDAAQEHAEDLAAIERTACLRIVDRFITDEKLRDQIRAAVMNERGKTLHAATLKMTYDEVKRDWQGEWALAK